MEPEEFNIRLQAQKKCKKKIANVSEKVVYSQTN